MGDKWFRVCASSFVPGCGGEEEEEGEGVWPHRDADPAFRVVADPRGLAGWEETLDG